MASGLCCLWLHSRPRGHGETCCCHLQWQGLLWLFANLEMVLGTPPTRACCQLRGCPSRTMRVLWGYAVCMLGNRQNLLLFQGRFSIDIAGAFLKQAPEVLAGHTGSSGVLSCPGTLRAPSGSCSAQVPAGAGSTRCPSLAACLALLCSAEPPRGQCTGTATCCVPACWVCTNLPS